MADVPVFVLPICYEKGILTECSICCETYKFAVTLSPCGHNYCNICIEHWLASNTTCPQCRVVVNAKPITARFLRQFISKMQKKEQQLEVTNILMRGNQLMHDFKSIKKIVEQKGNRPHPVCGDDAEKMFRCEVRAQELLLKARECIKGLQTNEEETPSFVPVLTQMVDYFLRARKASRLERGGWVYINDISSRAKLIVHGISEKTTPQEIKNRLAMYSTGTGAVGKEELSGVELIDQEVGGILQHGTNAPTSNQLNYKVTGGYDIYFRSRPLLVGRSLQDYGIDSPLKAFNIQLELKFRRQAKVKKPDTDIVDD